MRLCLSGNLDGLIVCNGGKCIADENALALAENAATSLTLSVLLVAIEVKIWDWYFWRPFELLDVIGTIDLFIQQKILFKFCI